MLQPKTTVKSLLALGLLLIHAQLPVAAQGGDLESLLQTAKEQRKARSYLEAEQTLEEARNLSAHAEGLALDRIAYLYFLSGNNQNSLGRPDLALPFYEKSIHLYESNGWADSIATAKVYGNAANRYSNSGNLFKALEYHQKSFRIKCALLPPGHYLLSKSLTNIGSIHEMMGEYEKAAAYFDEALLLRQQNENTKPRHLATALANRGIVYVRQDSIPKGIQLLDQSLDMIDPEKSPDLFCNVSLALGEAAFKAAHMERAETILEKAIQTVRSRRLHARLLVASGNLKTASGRFEEALAEHQNALALLLPAFQPGDKFSLPPSQLLRSDPTILTALQGKTKTLLFIFRQSPDRSLADHAFAHIDLAFRQMEAMRNSYTGVSTNAKVFLNEYLYPFTEAAIDFAVDAANTLQAPAYELKALQYSEWSRSGLLLESISGQQALREAEVPEAKILRAQMLRQTLDGLQHEGANSMQTSEISDSLLNLKRELAQIELEFREVHPRLDSLSSRPSLPDIHRFVQRHGKNAVLLEYFVGDSTIFVFGLYQSNFVIQRIPHGPAMSHHIQQFYTSVSTSPRMGSTSPLSLAQSGHFLYQHLLAQVLDSLGSESSAPLIIIPDGPLWQFPFEALLTQMPEEPTRYSHFPYLIHQNQVHYAWSISVLEQQLAASHAPASKRLALIAPSYQGLAANQNGAGFPVHPLAMRKIPPAASVLDASPFSSDAVQFAGSMATDVKLLQALTEFEIVHFHGHAAIDPSDPRRTALLLAPDPKLRSDGFCDTWEIRDRPIQSQLVVLDACATANGPLQRGEGAASLSRAFTEGGCRIVVSSLYPVPISSSNAIMQPFYQELSRDKSVTDALRTARLAYLQNESIEEIDAHPFFWATFVAVGLDYTPGTDFGMPAGIYWGIALLAILAFGWIWKFRKRRTGV